MWKSVIIALVLAACGGSKPSTQTSTGTGNGTGTGTGTDTEEPAALGDEGAVCGCGEMSEGTCVAVECRPDLVCGYGCGIPGCDNTCMTQQEFEDSANIP